MSGQQRSTDPSLLLLPNIGGEEEPGWRASASLPAVRSLARLWCSLFDRGAQPIAADPQAVEALRSPHQAPAFDWLPRSAGTHEGRGAHAPSAIAWYGGTPAERDPALAGASPLGPPAEIVDRVHDKAFALRVAQREGLCPPPLAECIAICENHELADDHRALAALRARVDAWPEWARARAVLKPRLGSSGRGRLDLRRPASLELDAEIRAALPRLAAQGGAVLEPWLERCEDLSVVLRIDPAGDLHLLGSLTALIAARGRPLGHRGELDSRGRVFSGSECDEAMRAAAAIAATAAREEGFHGPCGVDGFRYRDPAGRVQLRAICELNARFTTGLVLLGVLRRDRERICEALGLRPGERAGFCFAWDEPRARGCESWEEARRQVHGPSILLLFPSEAGGREPRPGLLVAREPAAIDPVARAVLARTEGS